jgi:Domain of unknown function (DUF4145)
VNVILCKATQEKASAIRSSWPAIPQYGGLTRHYLSGAVHYLRQAKNTLANADASVVMSTAAIDAMLKDHGLKDGSLYKRIDETVNAGVLTKRMAEWAHRVRLDANNPRHADEQTPHMSADEARRAFEFAEALGDFLYVLPSRMPREG